MKVQFGCLDKILDELEEKCVKEVRVESLYDLTRDSFGIPMLKLFVNVDAHLSDSLYARYQRVTFKDIDPSFSCDEQKRKEVFDNNRKVCEEIKAEIQKRGFTIRAGFIKEGNNR